MILPRRQLAITVAAIAGVTAATVVSLTLGSPAGAVPGCADTPDFTHSIPGPIGGPAAAPGATRVLYATIGGDRKVYTAPTDISGPDLAVDPLSCLGGGAVDTPAVAGWGGGQAFYVLAPNGRIYERYIGAGETGPPWSLVPGAPVGGGSPAVASATSGATDYVYLFVRGSNGQLYWASRAFDASAQPWSAWQSLGGGMTGVAAVGEAYGFLTVVIRAPNGTLYQRLRSNGGVWSAWQKIPGTTSASPTIASGFSPGRLDLFVTGTTGGLYQSLYYAGQTFNPFRKVTADLPPGAKVAAAGSDGRMAVYATVREGGGSVVGLNQYLPGQGPGLGWSGFLLAPYTCEVTCLPEPGPIAGSRVVRRTPLG